MKILVDTHVFVRTVHVVSLHHLAAMQAIGALRDANRELRTVPQVL